MPAPMLATPETATDRSLYDLVQRYASIIERFGNDIGRRPMALPNAEFFPDRFTGDLPSVTRLLRRMQGHAGMQDIRSKSAWSIQTLTQRLAAPEAAAAAAARRRACLRV